MFAYCLSASATRCGFSLVKTDTCRAGEIFSDGNVSISNFDFEQAEWKLVAKDSNWTFLTLKCLWRVCLWLGDFRLIFGFSKEKEFMSLNRESLDQVSNSKAPFCLCFRLLDGGASESRGYCQCGRDGSPCSCGRSQVTPSVETPPPEGVLTESNELTSTMSVELTTARAKTEALLEAIEEVSTCGRRGRSRGNCKVDQSDVVGSKSTKIHFTGSQCGDEADCREEIGSATSCSYWFSGSGWAFAADQWWHWIQSQYVGPELCERLEGPTG